ncbi:unnamed protein product [Mytilus coruscus]|uniref:Uncharacterized protein n=1 Tax=Mytilus coruscus TaxID=42192 RepID=A0A6J8AUK0_MYTCO|nr:unnamed protein product [Mytilus coruscus]
MPAVRLMYGTSGYTDIGIAGRCMAFYIKGATQLIKFDLKVACAKFFFCDVYLSGLQYEIVQPEASPWRCYGLTNHLLIYLECKTGMTTDAGGRCVSCKNDMYGYKCIKKCVCNQFHSCFILTALCHLFRTYRNRHALSFEVVNEEVILKPLELTLYNDDIYDEVDENSLTFVTTGSNIPSQASQNEIINFVFNERHFSTTDNGNDEVGYLDLYFAMKEDKNRQVEVRSSQTERLSTSSSNSDVVVQQNMEYPKPYIPLQQYCQDDSHSCIDDDATSNIYSNGCIPLQKDRQINSQSNESHLSSDSMIVHETTLPFIIPSAFRTCYLQHCINKYAESEKTIDACGAIDSYEDKSIKNEKSKTF